MSSRTVKFTHWQKWTTYKELFPNESKRAGVYMLALFSRSVPTGKAKSNIKEIIYFGETTKQTLNKRFYQFHITAFGDKNYHSGGSTFKENLNHNRNRLYVAIYVPNKNNVKYLAQNIKFHERRLIYKYCLLHGKLPACNII